MSRSRPDGRGARDPGPRDLPPIWQGPRRGMLTALVALAWLQGLLAVAVALLGRAAFDAPDPPSAWPPLVTMLLAMVGIAAARYAEIERAESLAQHYIGEVRLALFEALSTLSMSRRRHRSRGGVLLRFMGDAQALRDWVGRGLARVIAGSCALVALLVGLALLSPPLAVAAMLWSLVAGLAMGVTLPSVQRSARESRLRQANIASNMHDRLATLPLMQSAGQSRRETARLDRQNQRFAAAMQLHAQARARHRLVLDLLLGGMAASIVAILWLDRDLVPALPGGEGTGTLVGAIALVGLLSAPLRRIGHALEGHASAVIARLRIAEFLAEREGVASQVPTSEVPAAPALRLEGVSVAGRLEGVHGEAAWGRRIAITGLPGSGKSALLGAMARLIPASGGRIVLGGVPLQALTDGQLSEHLAYVSPELPPLRGTVRSNLRYRVHRPDEESIRAACRLAGWPPGEPMDEGRRVVDDGATLSGDERRALVLARALVGQPSVLLIDEIEHCLPAPGLASLARLLDGFPGTVVYSTAMADWAARADEVWTLVQGRLTTATAPATGPAAATTALTGTAPGAAPPRPPLRLVQAADATGGIEA